MSVTYEQVVRQRHRRTGPWPSPDGKRWAADCSCGWVGPIVGTSAEAIKSHDKHRSDPKARVR